MSRDEGGVPSEACLPYFGTGEGIDHFVSSMNAPACRADRQAGFARSHTADLSFLVGLNSGASTLTADGVSLAKGAFFTSGPVAVAMPVTNAFFSYSSGVFDDGESCGQAPGHAASLIGYTADAWVGMNSWGAHWCLGDRLCRAEGLNRRTPRC